MKAGVDLGRWDLMLPEQQRVMRSVRVNLLIFPLQFRCVVSLFICRHPSSILHPGAWIIFLKHNSMWFSCLCLFPMSLKQHVSLLWDSRSDNLIPNYLFRWLLCFLSVQSPTFFKVVYLPACFCLGPSTALEYFCLLLFHFEAWINLSPLSSLSKSCLSSLSSLYPFLVF